MKVQIVAAFVVVSLLFGFGQTQRSSAQQSNAYVNELPSLRLYEKAKWKSIVPYESTRADVGRILGKPAPIMVEGIGWIAGYDSDPDWKIVVLIIGGGPGCSPLLIGRVSSIFLWPKKTISLKGVMFPSEFDRSGGRKDGIDYMLYRDSSGLVYVVADSDSADGRIHAGDLLKVSYSAPAELTNDC